MNPLGRLFALFHRSKLDREMAEEMATHLERETEQNLARGLPSDEAWYAARRAFGGLDQLQERERDARGWRWLEDLLRDLRFATRSLRKNPGYSGVAIVSLGLGIGACTAVFSVANGILLRSLPVPNPEVLRVLHWSGTNLRIPSWNGGDTSFTPPMFFHLRERAAAEASVFGFVPLTDLIAQAGGQAFPARGVMVSDNYFAGLEVQPFLGRALGTPDDFAGAGTRVVLSYRLWESQFASDPEAVGRVLRLNGTGYTIVGVLPPGFAGAEAGNPGDLYVPMAGRSQFLYRPLTSNFHWYVRVLARLKPGARDAQLAAVLNTVWRREAAEFMEHPILRVAPGHAGESIERTAYRNPLLLLLGVVGIVMLVACANLAGLSLARGAARQHEFAIRAALGSGRIRIVRQALAENALLALAGGGLGLIAAHWMREAIANLLAGSQGSLLYDFSIDRRVLAFALILAVLTAVLTGVVPALRASRVDPIDGLKNRSAMSPLRLRNGRILVAVQTGLSAVLLAGTVLFVRSLLNLARADPGFSTRHLLLLAVNINGAPRAEADPAGFYGQLQDSLAALPGVRGASLIHFPLLSGANSSGGFDSFSHRPARGGSSMETRRLTVGETFFSTLDVPIVLGRGFTPADAEGAPKVIVVNEAFVRKYLPDEDPLGLTIPVWDADWKIVGVCRDIHYSTVKGGVPPTTYFPFRQRFYSRFRTTHLRSVYFVARTVLPPLSLAPAVRRTVADIDPNVAVESITTQDEVRSRSAGESRLFAYLCASLTAVTLLLACIGLYGLLAYNVAQRTNEFGVRLALGGTSSAIARPILREALVLVGAGLAIGLPMALGLARLVRHRLYAVSPTDPWPLAIGAGVLLVVAMLAAWLPARRAARVDPMIALRAE